MSDFSNIFPLRKALEKFDIILSIDVESRIPIMLNKIDQATENNEDGILQIHQLTLSAFYHAYNPSVAGCDID